jgi:arylsulfatase A-like enzyme
MAACDGGAARGPNVLLISLDTVRADELSFLDPEVAPNMTALARRGVIFEQAIAGSSWTLPSHAQIFTGQPPSLHRVETDDLAIDGRTPILAEELRRRGWFTAGFWTGWYLAGEHGFDRGFMAYENCMTDGELVDARVRHSLDGESINGAWQALSQRDKQNHEDVTSENVVEHVSRVLEQVDAEDRVFAFAHFFDPHYDLIPPAPYDTRFDPAYTGTIDGRNFWVNPAIWTPDKGRVVSDRDLEHLRALYRGEIAWTDAAVGKLIERLRADGRLDDTLIVIVGDHGEEFFEHQNRGHRQSLYDEVLRVPLLIVPPGATERATPRRVETQVSLSDVMPTILDYCGLDVPGSVHGRSLRPAVEGRAFESRPAVSSLMLFNSAADGTWTVNLHETLRMPTYKLWRMTQVDQNLKPQVAFFGMCRLQQDPAEQVWSNDDPGLRDAWNLLEAELAGMRKIHAASDHAPASKRTTNMAKLLESELRGLGYVGAESSGEESVGLLVPWGLGVRPPAALP